MPKWSLQISDEVWGQVESAYCRLPDSHDLEVDAVAFVTRADLTSFVKRFDSELQGDVDELFAQAVPFARNPDIRLFVDGPFQLIFALDSIAGVVEIVDFAMLV